MEYFKAMNLLGNPTNQTFESVTKNWVEKKDIDIEHMTLVVK